MEKIAEDNKITEINFKPELVSILIPTYNQKEEYLTQCVYSCLSQTYEKIEVILSDNFTNNSSRHFIQNLDYDNVRVVRPDRFLNMNDNFAFCASFAKGEFISFLSSDDILFSKSIEKLVTAIKLNSSAAFAFGNCYHSNRIPTKYKKSLLVRSPMNGQSIYLEGEVGQKFFFPWDLSSTWMVGNLIKSTSYNRIGGFSAFNLEVSGDVWITQKLLNQGGFVYLDEVLALFRSRSVGHIEVDPDRRLLDFIDHVLLNKNTIQYTTRGRLREVLVFIYRIGVDRRTSDSVKNKAVRKFVDINRYDLSMLAKGSIEFPVLFYILAKILGAPKFIRDVIRELCRKI